MELNLVFSAVVYLLIFMLSFYIIKIILDIQRINIKGKHKYLNLQKILQISKEKNRIINNKMVLVEGLYETLFNRLFKINTELILIQKLFFDKRT